MFFIAACTLLLLRPAVAVIPAQILEFQNWIRTDDPRAKHLVPGLTSRMQRDFGAVNSKKSHVFRDAVSTPAASTPAGEPRRSLAATLPSGQYSTSSLDLMRTVAEQDEAARQRFAREPTLDTLYTYLTKQESCENGCEVTGGVVLDRRLDYRVTVSVVQGDMVAAGEKLTR